MPHKIKSPPDYAIIVISRHPACNSKNAIVLVNRIQNLYSRIMQFFQTAKSKLHFWKGFKFCPFFRNLNNLLLNFPRNIVVCAKNIRYSITFCLVYGSANILPLFTPSLPLFRVDKHIASNFYRRKTKRFQGFSFFIMNSVECWRPRILLANLNERFQILFIFCFISERTS